MPYLFSGQRSSEDVLLVTRQHPFVLFHPFLICTLIALIPLAANVVLAFGTPLALILAACMLFSLGHAAMAGYSWYNSVFMLTDQRVVLVHQKGLLHREFSECGLHGIQQVSHEIKGVLHTLFGYGHIMIYTGGSQTPFQLPNIPDPHGVQQEIQRVAADDEE